MKDITKKQQKILEYISQCQKNGITPTQAEIAHYFNISSPTAIKQQLVSIEKKGYIELISEKARGIKILVDIPEEENRTIKIPIAGVITAGRPILASENIEDYIYLDKNKFPGKNIFALKIKGDSMKNASILDGDIVVINKINTAENGDIIAALIDDEATIKRFYKKNGKIILHPENHDYDDIEVNVNSGFSILGKVIGIIRDEIK